MRWEFFLLIPALLLGFLGGWIAGARHAYWRFRQVMVGRMQDRDPLQLIRRKRWLKKLWNLRETSKLEHEELPE